MREPIEPIRRYRRKKVDKLGEEIRPYILKGNVHFKRLIIIHGIRRSGNHAAFNWILPHLPGITCYLHDYHFTEEIVSADHFIKSEGDVMRLQGSSPILDARRNLRPFSSFEADNLIVGAENSDISKLNTFLEDHGVIADRTDKVLILRDYRNNAASRSKKEGLISEPEFQRLWEMYAREYLGETEYLGDFIPFLYNEWFSSLEYRKILSGFFGLPHTDYGLNMVSPAAMGSSFDNADYHGKAQKMKVLERWKLVDIPYKQELIDLSERIFKC